MRAAQQLEDAFGPLDIWVNDAMTTVFAPLTQIEPDEFKRATEVTYLGCVYGTMAALKHMKQRDIGTIVQVGSALAYRSIPLQSAYCGAKHAIIGFTDSLRCELIHQRSGIHVTAVDLPAMNTPQFSWCRTKMPNHPQPVPPILNRRWRPGRFIGRRITSDAKYSSALLQSQLYTGRMSPRVLPTGISAKADTNPNKPRSQFRPIARTIFSNRFPAITRHMGSLPTSRRTAVCRLG